MPSSPDLPLLRYRCRRVFRLHPRPAAQLAVCCVPLAQRVGLSSDGSVIAIGANYNDDNGSNSGHVRIYKNVNNNWIKVGGDVNGEAADDYSGESVSLSADGTKVAIGATSNDGNGSISGDVRVYQIYFD